MDWFSNLRSELVTGGGPIANGTVSKLARG